ncbi:MAG: hypothetical protein SPI25_04225 [Dialister sp.]|nr:hypothetical protein [Dialister sp.]
MAESDTLHRVRASFTAPAAQFETKAMNFSKNNYLDYTLHTMELSKRSGAGRAVP